MSNKRMRTLVLSDDLTGSNDTGVQFQRRGFRTTVMLPNFVDYTNTQQNSEVLVIDTETRFSTPEEAYKKVRSATENYANRFDLIYKKVDSTMRGNIGIEIKAVVEASGASLVVMVPAFPAAGRTTKNGKCLVHGDPVHLTDLVKDPRTPVSESDIGLTIQSQYDVKTIIIKKERREMLFHEIMAKKNREYPLVLIFDAENEADLEDIWALTADIGEKTVYSGSAGFATYLGREKVQNLGGPIFFVLGSVNQRSIEQACRLPKSIEWVDLDMLSVFDPANTSLVDELVKRIRSNLVHGTHVAIRSVWDRQQYEQNLDLLKTKNGLQTHEIAERIASVIANICKKVIDQTKISKIFLTGGDIAIHVLKQLGVTTMEVVEEIAPGIPEASIQIGERRLRVITKAGGFGELDVLHRVLDYWTIPNFEETTK